MTKRVWITWTRSNGPMETPPVTDWDIARQATLNSMIAQGKHDGNWHHPEMPEDLVDYRHVGRDFIDQAAAQEWLDFLIDQSTKLSNPIISSEIIDI